VTNAVTITTNPTLLDLVARPYRDWTIDLGHSGVGLLEWDRGHTAIYIFRYIITVPLSAPAVAVALFLLILLFLVAGYYYFANLRHKDAATS